MSEQKVVLITGVSSGIGQAIAQLLVNKGGFTVFGTSRNPSGVATMPGVELLPLDVCLDESVKACVDAVVKRVGRLDILVDNAGYILRGAIEEATLDEAKAQFETNFFGAVRMVKTVLPIMRKQGSGQIINISSGVGLAPFPFVGFYSASKFALEGYTEALRHEVKPFHIKVSLVEPGFIKTRLYHNMQRAAEQISDYDLWQQKASKAREQYVEKALDPTLVAECILSIIENKSPGLRHIVGREVARSVWLRRFLPESMFEKGVRRFLQLDVKKSDIFSSND
jgi:NAD(P)-dependent dehydrogenase (short-subunit alcohol dehydrogenase family)